MACYLQIVEELTAFTCAMYICAAPADHWGIKASAELYDDMSSKILSLLHIPEPRDS